MVIVCPDARNSEKLIFQARRKGIMVHLIIMTIEHNSVEYINVPFKYALFRDKSN